MVIKLFLCKWSECTVIQGQGLKASLKLWFWFFFSFPGFGEIISFFEKGMVSRKLLVCQNGQVDVTMSMSKSESTPSFTKKMQHFFQETTNKKKKDAEKNRAAFLLRVPKKSSFCPHPIRNDVGALKEVRKFSLVCA